MAAGDLVLESNAFDFICLGRGLVQHRDFDNGSGGGSFMARIHPLVQALAELEVWNGLAG